jgi:glycosyltransferase involved in cell wall biosynthesis
MNNEEIDISIITPSYNMLPHLKKCSASIADQVGAHVEHIVIDGLSADGSVEWLRSKPDIICLAEKDRGMYDALNKGLKMARGEIIGYLNCDEQYLPGTLAKVKSFFDNHPKVDIFFGSFLVVAPDGALISFRKAYSPRWRYILSSYLYTFSCAMFFRKSLTDEGLLFDSAFKAVADADFVVRALRKGHEAGTTKQYLSVFAFSGSNMSLGENAQQERRRYLASAPFMVRKFRVVLNTARLVEKMLSGAYFQFGQISYEIYTTEGCEKRHLFSFDSASQEYPGTKGSE